MSVPYSAASADSTSAWSAPACESSGSASETPSLVACSPIAGPASPASGTSETSPPADEGSMFSAEAFRVSPSATTVTASSRRTSAGYGLSSLESFARFDPDTSSWRTWQLSFVEDSAMSSPTWPRSGMTRSGTAYRLPPSVLPIAASACSWWPTPNASDQKRVREFSHESLRKTYRSRPRGAAYLTETLMAIYGWCHHPTFSEWLMGFPLGWTSPGSRLSGTRSSLRSLSGSDGESSPMRKAA